MSNSAYKFLRTFGRDQSGAVAVEFVLIAPILFALLFGTIVVAYFIGLNHSVSQLATGAARASVAGLDMQERVSIAEDYLAQASVRYPLLSQDALSPVVVVQDTEPQGMTVNITYEIADSILGLANAFLGMSISNITGSAYLAY